MHWVRRIHLYSGLFMLPWVLLYGITALLFNHPQVFADRLTHTLTREAFAGTALEPLTDPAADAKQVVAALNGKLTGDGDSGRALRLIEPERAVYTRDVIVARARGAGQEHSVRIDLPGGTAFVTTSDHRQTEQPPFAMRGLKVPGSLSERVKAGLPKALSREGFHADDAGIAIGAELLFLVEADGRIWRAAYHPQTGAVSGTPAEGDSDLGTRELLTQLHLLHGYPSQASIKWVWALLVDMMFASMVFWGVSGVLMWWRLKSVRVAGAVVLTASLLLSTALIFCMYRVLSPL